MAQVPAKFDMTDTTPVGQGVPTKFDMTDTTPVDAGTLHEVDTSPLEEGTGEGTYWMRDKSGAQKKIPYGKVSRATQGGYELIDKRGYLNDVSHDPKHTQGGSLVVGLNAFNQPILAPVQGPTSGTWGRIGSSLWNQLKSVPTGVYHAVTDAPKTAEETEYLNSDPSMFRRADLAVKRMVIDPQVEEGRKAWQNAKEGNISLAAGHGLAAAIPGIGPMWANIAEQVGEQIGMGDYAGALGSLAGGAIVEEAPKVGGKALRSEFVTNKMPKSTITRMIRSGTGDIRFGKDPAEGILREGIVGNSLEAVGDKVSDKLQDVGRQIDIAAQAYPNVRINVASALRPLDDAIAEAARNGPQELYDRLKTIRHDVTSVWAERRLPTGDTERYRVGPKNMSMSPLEALQFKRLIGDRVKWTSDPLQGDVNKAMGATYGSVKDALNAPMPKDFRELNDRYANLVGAAKAIQRRIPVENRNAHWSLSDIALAGTGHIPMAIARKVAMTPGFRTRWAQAAYRHGRTPPPTGLKAAVPYVAASTLASQPTQSVKRYAQTATGPNGHRIGSDDGMTWFDLQTNQRVQ